MVSGKVARCPWESLREPRSVAEHMGQVINDDWKAVGARVRAARVAAGLPTRAALAHQLKLPRFGSKTIGSVERGERQLHEHEATELGRVLGVDGRSFFDAPAGSQLDRIEAKLDWLINALTATARQDGGKLPGGWPRLPEGLRPDGEDQRRTA